MAIIRFRDENGEVKELTALRGEKGEGVFVVTVEGDTPSHSSAEIKAAHDAGHAVFLKINNRLIPIGYADAASSYFYDVQVGGAGARTTEYAVDGTMLVVSSNAYFPPVDTSLTQKYVAADAKTVGDRLASSDRSYANALKGTASGESICLDDVSPLSRELTVNVSADVGKLKVYEKNLFNLSVLADAGFTTIDDASVGEFTFKKTSGIIGTPIAALPNTSYYVSGYCKGVVEGQSVSCSAFFTDGSNTNFNVTAVVGEYLRFEGKTRSDKTLAYIKFGAGGGLKVGTSFKEVQVELSDAATPYEPYNETQYTPNADGTVEGVTARYPVTTLMTDTAGGVINVEYTKDTNKVIEKLTQAIIALGGNV